MASTWVLYDTYRLQAGEITDMSLISGLKSFAKKTGLASLGLPGLMIMKSQEKAAAAKTDAGPQQAGNKGTSVGKTLLRGLLGPAGLLLGK